MFPQAIGNAATWDAPLIHSIGEVVSTEARAKYNDAIAHDNHDRYYGLTIWSPNINIFRDPRWGRGQETYGEDPFLTARLGTAFVKGIQGDDPKYFRAIATPKHYAVHSGPESTRHKANIDPTPHDLWDTYLPAFRATITEGHADSLMCSYNAVDNVPACASKMLLGDILRNDWHFQGFVTSDCGAIGDFSESYGHHYSADFAAGSAAGILAGTDTDCGTEYLKLTDAVKKGLLTKAQLDVSARRLFTARMKLGMFDPPQQVPFSSIPFSVVNSPEHAELALRAARESMVLLKNDSHFLPSRSREAPDHRRDRSARRLSHRSRRQLQRHPARARSSPSMACSPSLATTMSSMPRIRLTFQRANSPYRAPCSAPQATRLLRASKASTSPTPTSTALPRRSASTRKSTSTGPSPIPSSPLTPPRRPSPFVGSAPSAPPSPKRSNSSSACRSAYPCDGKLKFAIYLDGKQLEPAAPPTPTTSKLPPSGRNYGAIQHFAIPFADTRPHDLRIDYVQTGRIPGAGLAFEWTPPQELLQDQAIEAAKKADVVVAFVGLTPRLEGEEMRVNAKGFSGGDRTDIELPDVQQQMLEAVAKTGKPMVVVLLNGSALAVNWAKQNAGALLEAWYPGQSGGQAIAETLSGKNNPAGRLPVTFYTGVGSTSCLRRLLHGQPHLPLLQRQTPLCLRRRPELHHLRLFRFTSSRPQSLKAGDTLIVQAEVRNAGSLPGDEVSELYLDPSAIRPCSQDSPSSVSCDSTSIPAKPGTSLSPSIPALSRKLMKRESAP